MKMIREPWIQIGVGLAIVLVLVVVVAAQPIGAVDAESPRAAAAQLAIVSLQQALHEGLPLVIVFMPVEQCAIQYCVTAELVARRLAGQSINVVEAPVYAVPPQRRNGRPVYPMIDWGVYLVEPFVTWLPEFSEGEFGYGLDATAVALLDANREVVIIHQRLTDIDGFAQEAMAYSTVPAMIKRTQ